MTVQAVNSFPKPSLTLKLVSSAQFKSLTEAVTLKEVKSPYWATNRATLENGAYTKYVRNCNAAVIQNPDQVTLAHLSPETQDIIQMTPQGEKKAVSLWPTIEPELTQDVENLRKQNSPLQTLLIGGHDWETDPIQFSTKTEPHRLTPNSRKMFHLLNTIFTKLKLENISTIWGGMSFYNNGDVNILADPKSKTIYLNVLDPADRDILSFEKLLETFRIIKIAAGHTLETSSRTIQGPWENCFRLLQLNKKKVIT